MTRWFYLTAALLGAALLTGCTATMRGMQGMHGMHGGGQGGGTTVIKEVREGDLTVTLTVPPLTLNREAVLQLTARHAVTNEPITDAHVSVMIRRSAGGAGAGSTSTNGNGSGHAGHSGHMGSQEAQTAGSVTLEDESVTLQQESPGAFRAPYTVRTSGPREIRVGVHRAADGSAPVMLEFAATQQVAEHDMSAGVSKKWIVLGGAAMAGMMVLRWVVF